MRWGHWLRQALLAGTLLAAPNQAQEFTPMDPKQREELAAKTSPMPQTYRDTLSSCNTLQIVDAWVKGMPEWYYAELAGMRKGDEPLFTCAQILSAYGSSMPPAYARRFAERINSADSDINGRYVLEFWASDAIEERLTPLIKLALSAGAKLEMLLDMAMLDISSGPWKEDPVQYLDAFSGSDVRAYRYRQIGLSATLAKTGGFIDTEKPNAVVIYPFSDWNGAFYGIVERAVSETAPWRLMGSYDVLTFVADTRDDICRAVRMAGTADLLVIKGHGSSQSLSLGEKDLRLFEPGESRDQVIGIDEKMLGACLDRHLSLDAKILLVSCEVGYGEGNLVLSLAKASQRTVIGSRTVVSEESVRIQQYRPLAVRIFDADNLSRDSTYTAGTVSSDDR